MAEPGTAQHALRQHVVVVGADTTVRLAEELVRSGEQLVVIAHGDRHRDDQPTPRRTPDFADRGLHAALLRRVGRARLRRGRSRDAGHAVFRDCRPYGRCGSGAPDRRRTACRYRGHPPHRNRRRTSTRRWRPGARHEADRHGPKRRTDERDAACSAWCYRPASQPSSSMP